MKIIWKTIVRKAIFKAPWVAVIYFSFAGVSCLAENESLSLPAQEILSKLPFCEVGKRLLVPPEVIAGVFLFENQINRGFKDAVQDSAFRILLASSDDRWWPIWAKRTMEMADRAEPLRLQSNRWPVDLVATGLVVSIGPAQVTPRTALLACDAIVPRADVCGRGVRDLIESLLDETKSLNVVALVLRYEAIDHLKITGDDVSLDIGQWATIYNVGGNYFRRNQNGKVAKANRFGQWVASEASALRDALKCSQ
jgi:hypothetical protein